MNDNPPDLYGLLVPVHGTVMILAFTAMLTGMILARYFKKKKWWLKVHRLLGVVGAALGIGGAITAAYIVSRTTGIHLRITHSWAGLSALLLFAFTPILGFIMLKGGPHAKTFRKIHRWTGRLALLVMAAAILLAWVYLNFG